MKVWNVLLGICSPGSEGAQLLAVFTHLLWCVEDDALTRSEAHSFNQQAFCPSAASQGSRSWVKDLRASPLLGVWRKYWLWSEDVRQRQEGSRETLGSRTEHVPQRSCTPGRGSWAACALTPMDHWLSMDPWGLYPAAGEGKGSFCGQRKCSAEGVPSWQVQVEPAWTKMIRTRGYGWGNDGICYIFFEDFLCARHSQIMLNEMDFVCL